MFYTKNEIYDEETLNNNKLNEKSYEYLINKCKLAIEEFRKKNALSEQEKMENYKKLVEKQVLINNNKNQENIPNNKDNSNINNIKNNINNNIIISQKYMIYYKYIKLIKI